MTVSHPPPPLYFLVPDNRPRLFEFHRDDLHCPTEAVLEIPSVGWPGRACTRSGSMRSVRDNALRDIPSCTAATTQGGGRLRVQVRFKVCVVGEGTKSKIGFKGFARELAERYCTGKKGCRKIYNSCRKKERQLIDVTVVRRVRPRAIVSAVALLALAHGPSLGQSPPTDVSP